MNALEKDPNVVGHYRLVSELGRGGMATVHEAEHLRLPRKTAIKRMLPELADDDVAVARFLREARAAAEVRHPNVVNVFDSGVHAGIPYLVMDLVEGRTLASMMASTAPLETAAVVDLFLPILSAIAECHAAGIVHRDLKPQNVIVRSDATGARDPVIVDFGVAKHMGEDEPAALTASGVLIGTVGYMAPEQVRDARSATPESDQFSLGVMLYQCLTGRMPFSGNGTDEILHAVLHEAPVPPSHLEPAVSEELDAVILRALSRDARERHPSAQAFGAALLTFASASAAQKYKRDFVRGAEGSAIADGGTLADRPARASDVASPMIARGHRARPRRLVQLLAGGVAAAVGAVAIAGMTFTEQRTRREDAAPAAPPAALTSAPPPAPMAPIAPASNVAPEMLEAPVMASTSSPVHEASRAPSPATQAGDVAGSTHQTPIPKRYIGPRGTNGAPIVE